MRKSLVTLCAHEPGMTMLRFKNSRSRMDQDRNIKPGDLFVERPQYFIVEIPVRPATAELDRFHTEVLDRPAQFANRLLDIRQIDPGATDETTIAADIFGSGLVVCACQLPPELGIEFIDQHPVVGDQNLNIETVLLHEFRAQLRTPTTLFERVDLLAVPVVGRHLSRHQLTETNEVALVWCNFHIPFARMGHFVDET